MTRVRVQVGKDEKYPAGSIVIVESEDHAKTALPNSTILGEVGVDEVVASQVIGSDAIDDEGPIEPPTDNLPTLGDTGQATGEGSSDAVDGQTDADAPDLDAIPTLGDIGEATGEGGSDAVDGETDADAPVIKKRRAKPARNA